MASELVCRADFSWKLLCGAGPGDLGGVPGIGFGRESRENRAEDFQPDCVEVPSKTELELASGTGFSCKLNCRAGPAI